MSQVDVSAEVRAFYERHPYPAPISDLTGYRKRWKQGDRRRVAFHTLWPRQKYRADIQVLVAGCGTSQAAKHAMREPASTVVAIDISESSLAHTRMLKDKYKLKNLEILRLDLEQAGTLGRKFDKIVCTGVLHHLPDPDAGLRSLREVLKPAGAMQLMVYAAYGRTGIYMLQDYCRLLGVRADEQDLETLGSVLGEIPAGHPLAPLLARAKDFRTPAALADALLNPQDRAYTVSQLYAWLERCDCTFGRWMMQAPYQPQCGFVASGPHRERLRALTSREQHAALELLRGTMATHEFVAHRDPRAEANAIQFADDEWLRYVPIRLTAARTITDRLPPGAAAVLLNPSHRHTDIYLPVGPVEKRWVEAIDGRRNIRDIAGTGNKEAARNFFLQLWRYDQIVIDASGS
jgi:SAM-dependent methyltransferase